MKIVTEEWKPVVGFEDTYRVSSTGRVQRRIASGWRELKPWLAGKTGYVAKDRYLSVGLYRKAKRTARSLHRLVAEHFIGPRPDGHEIDHIDGNKHNNHINNLRYVTPKQNRRHAMRMGLHVNPVGEHNGRSTSTEEHVRVAVALVKGGMTKAKAARRVGKTPGWLHSVYKGNTWKHLNISLN